MWMSAKKFGPAVHGSGVPSRLMAWLYPKNSTVKSGLSLMIRRVEYLGVPSVFITSNWWSRPIRATSASPDRIMNSRVAMSVALAMWTSFNVARARQYASNRSMMITWFRSQVRSLKGPVPQSPVPSRNALWVAHWVPPWARTQAFDTTDPTVNAIAWRNAGYGWVRWNTTVVGFTATTVESPTAWASATVRVVVSQLDCAGRTARMFGGTSARVGNELFTQSPIVLGTPGELSPTPYDT